MQTRNRHEPRRTAGGFGHEGLRHDEVRQKENPVAIPTTVNAPTRRTRPLSRRALLTAGAAGLAGLAAGAAGCGGPVQQGLLGTSARPNTLVYWNLFSGGDGENMTTMVDNYAAAHPDISVQATVLSWGTPYYTKLALATAGSSPPDVAVTHLSRLSTLAGNDLLQGFSPQQLGQAGLPTSNFTPAAMQKSTVNGTVYAIPLDTHPFVMFYNVAVCREAGLLDADGRLKPLRGPEQLQAAFAAAKKVTGQYGAVVAVTNDPSTNWRWFATLYYQLGGEVMSADGARVRLTLDDAKAEQALGFMRRLTSSGLMPATVDGAGVTSLFSTGKAGFLLDGEWQIPTYAATDLTFDVVPVPHVFGPKPVAFADSHALVLPRNPGMDEQKRSLALGFVKFLLEDSLVWAAGGHIPAWLPVQRSQAFTSLTPQSNYVEAALTAEYDPPGWFSGAGSQFENVVGAAVASCQNGTTSPAQAVQAIRSGLRPYLEATPPGT